MKPGDRVTRQKVLKYENPTGKIKKINKEYVVVLWDDIPGEWHYTHDQSKNLTIIEVNQ